MLFHLIFLSVFYPLTLRLLLYLCIASFLRSRTRSSSCSVYTILCGCSRSSINGYNTPFFYNHIKVQQTIFSTPLLHSFPLLSFFSIEMKKQKERVCTALQRGDRCVFRMKVPLVGRLFISSCMLRLYFTSIQ